ncbi:polyprenyl synthetase family protein [Kribbella sancticallisti]|uniref:Polyprenyl synthetase family protein n=2 Tax=Kribbella sancticallisti TaxID=460087 RepID=A0ABN2DUK2_9ACTN
MQRCADYFTAAETQVLRPVLESFVARGKYLRSSFAYLGWLCGRPESGAAARAIASLELLHAFALIQDDVMDDSATRRGEPTTHVQLTDWVRGRQQPVGEPDRFGRSAALLLSDLCLLWAERMLRESGLPTDAMARVWPVYDQMRSELAVGQYSDLLNEHAATTSFDTVMDIARRKSGNYSVLRPLQLGAASAGCGPLVMQMLQVYGIAVGEAFQLRDDLLGVFGDPAVTGKPVGDDLRQSKATSVIVAAYDLADPVQYQQLRDLSQTRPGPHDDSEEAWVRAWQEAIRATGADQFIERLIAERVVIATTALSRTDAVPNLPRDMLITLADRCTRRSR